MNLKKNLLLIVISLTANLVNAQVPNTKTQHQGFKISNPYFEINFLSTNNSLYTYKEKVTGEIIEISAPIFEIDGRQLLAQPASLQLSSKPDTLKNCVIEYHLKGKLKADAAMSLQVTFRVSAQSPVVRFCYTLQSTVPHLLTKKKGKDSLNYFSASFKKFTRFSEIQLADFNESSHSFVLNDKLVEERYFENNQAVTGPILVTENSKVSFMLAYEHGSQVPDRFITFGLSETKTISVKAVKGNYYNNQPLDATHPYETIWFELAGVKGDKQKLAQYYRNFILKDIAVNPASRTPYVYYNTWGFQERNKAWNSNRYLSSMNLSHTLQERNMAHRLGIDVFVLDAGWFGKTGDWQVNKTFFPDSLQVVKATLDSLNMKLGLWYSPTQAAVTSKIYKANADCITSYNGEASKPAEVWETEASYNMCMVSNYWKDCAAQMIRSAREYGNIYFKWDAISQYGCNSPQHNHGTLANTEQERMDCYAFALGRYLNKVVDSVASVVPNAIVDFDITEGWRSMGLQFLACGKYFHINNGPYYDTYNLPLPEKMLWNNIFVYPGAARAAICRSTLGYDKWIPSVLFLTHYLPDAPQTSQTINVASLILGQNGFWGDLLALSVESINHISGIIQKYKQVKNDITVSYPVTTGAINSLPEIHEKINEKNGRGALVIFSMAAIGHRYTYITKNKVDKNIWHNEDVQVSYDNQGRAIITCEFKDAAAKIIFFGVKQ